MFDRLTSKGFEILALHHAEAILTHDMPEAVRDLEEVLDNITLPVEELVRGGGGEGQLTQRIRNALAKEHGWEKHRFEIEKIVDGTRKEAISHEVDHVKRFPKGVFALEIEWNNKDPFYDRDLENFKRLHSDGVISIGGIITRGSGLHRGLKDILMQFAQNRSVESIKDLEPYNYKPSDRQKTLIFKAAEKYGFAEGWARAFVSDKFGEATTHWNKLEDRVRRGVGNPCPLLLIGIPREIVVI